MKILKEEKGSITLFVLIAMLFFVMYIVGLYMLSANSEGSQIAEVARIKEIYEQDVNNIDDVYNTELQKSYKLLSKIAKPGDYVKYDTGVTTVGNNGIVTFRVLYNDEANGLQIVSNKNVSTVTIGGSTFSEGMASYNNAIETLNNEAMKYKGTLGIDARCIGSVPNISENGVMTSKNTETEYTANIPDSWILPVEPEQWTSTDTGCKKGTDTNYTSSGEISIKRDKETMENLDLWITGENYWIASRWTYTGSYIYHFFVRFVHTDSSLGTNGLDCYTCCSVKPDGETKGYSNTLGLRPCISLKSAIKVLDGDGKTENTAYTLGI